MIDEKKLIEQLESYKNNDWNQQLCTSLPMVVDDCIDIVENQLKIGDWIPCSGRLPTESGEYNVTDECGISTTLYYEKENDRWVDIVEHYSVDHPSAWQSLPKPYKPG